MHQMQKPNARQSSSANVYQNISESKRKKYRQNFLILIVFLRAARSQNKLTLVILSDVNFNSNRHKCKNHHKMIAICCLFFWSLFWHARIYSSRVCTWSCLLSVLEFLIWIERCTFQMCADTHTYHDYISQHIRIHKMIQCEIFRLHEITNRASCIYNHINGQ